NRPAAPVRPARPGQLRRGAGPDGKIRSAPAAGAAGRSGGRHSHAAGGAPTARAGLLTGRGGVAPMVPDTAPLIALAVADALPCLTLVNVPVVVPDAVYLEATRHLDRPGAERIVSWMQERHRLVELAVTATGLDLQRRLAENPQARVR